MKNTSVSPVDTGQECGRRDGLHPFGQPVDSARQESHPAECCWVKVSYRSWAEGLTQQPESRGLQCKLSPVTGISKTPGRIPYKALALSFLWWGGMSCCLWDLSSLTRD